MGRTIEITTYWDDFSVKDGPWKHTLKTDSRDDVVEWVESWQKYMGHTMKVRDAQTGQNLAYMVKGYVPYVYQF